MSKRCLGCMELYGEEFEICPHCGYVEGTQPEEAIHMIPGTLLHNRYIIGKVLGYGGFGVTYIGWDGKLEQKVAIKEYLPSEFSTRMPGQSCITVFNGEKSEQFHDGLNKFVDEAKRLAKFQNEPGIVKVFDSFTENDTAYIIMEFLDGETLTERLKRDKIIPEDEAVNMLMPVMNSLQVVHQEGIIHRDIAPDNIFLTKSGDVKLIDFGASRFATTSHSRSLTVIIKPGYSPEEQYRSRGDQGPHTDVYAVAATLYKMVTGKTPPDAMERRAKIEMQKKEILEDPRKLNKKISVNRENAILNAMNVRIEDRTPDIQTFINELNADPPVKRRYGKIKKIDLYAWPLWLKIALPAFAVVLLTLGVLLFTGVINFPSLFSNRIVVPDGVVIVPDVEGMNKDEALDIIRKESLMPSPEGNVVSEYVEAGKIVLQSPVGGSYLDEYGTVVLTVSSGKGVVAAKDGISTVPYVIWDTQENAIKKLRQAGLAEPKIETKNDENVPAGQVISQSKEAGVELPEGSQITLVISLGPAAFEMPNFVGQNISEAEKALKERGVQVVIEYVKDSSLEPGTVKSQSIAPGGNVKSGGKVTLTVVSEAEIIQVANVVGSPQKDAVSALKAQGFSVTVLENYDQTVPAGIVISQSPSGGSSQEYGANVVIYVSKGKQPITVADVTGKTSTEASSTLNAQGLVVKVESQYNPDVAVGTVYDQSPKAGSTQYAGDTVTIYVSRGKEPIAIADVVGKQRNEAIQQLETQGFTTVVKEEYSETVEIDKVIGQSPGAGAIAYAGDAITITVSLGKKPISVANVVGQDKASAVSVLEKQGLKVESKEEYSETVAAGKVINQSPGANTIAYAGDQVTIIVSKGVEIKLSSSKETIVVGETIKLSANMTSGCTWYSDNNSIAIVSSDGIVEAVNTGTVNINVKNNQNNTTAKCSITVQGVTISQWSNCSAYIGSSANCSFSTNPKGYDKYITLSSNNSNIVSTSGQSYSAKNTGSAVITAKLNIKNYTTTMQFTVTVDRPLFGFSGNWTQEMKCHDCTVWTNHDYGFALSLPTAKVSHVSFVPNGSYEVVSGNAYVSNGRVYSRQPGTIKVRYSFTVNGVKYSSPDYSFRLMVTKTTSDINYINSIPEFNHPINKNKAYVPKDTYVEMTEIASSGTLGNSGSGLWGKVTYNGYTGWIIIFQYR